MKTIIIDEVNGVLYEINLTNDSLMEFKVIENDIEPYEEIFSGALKWDGCINLDFEECLHFCINPAPKFKAIFDRLYALGGEMMPNWDYKNIDKSE